MKRKLNYGIYKDCYEACYECLNRPACDKFNKRMKSAQLEQHRKLEQHIKSSVLKQHIKKFNR